ncbi:MAG: histidine ammonia-lyase [Calditrichia bacterium]
MEFSHSRQEALILNGDNLNLENLVLAARTAGYPVRLSAAARDRIRRSRQWVEQVQKTGSPVIYGINTGFGSKATVSISKEKLKDLQRNLIMSHAAGSGDPLPVEVVRAAMIMRINTFAKGYSGIRLEVVDTLLQMLQKDVTPWIPSQGSVGASGDLAPLSHMALVLSRGVEADLAEDSGRAWIREENGEVQLVSGLEAMKWAGIPRIVLEAKEGLALNNGTQISTALLALELSRAEKLVKQADIAMSMSLEALYGISAAFREELHMLRPHPGQVQTAANIRRITEGSQLLDRYPERVQDAYSLRCHPQVMAGVRDALAYIKQVAEREMNATNDNPIIFPDLNEKNRAISGGNFHAQPIAFAADILSMVLCEIGSIAERRIFRLSDKNLNNGLPSFLVKRDGLENGLMVAQYTAASLVSENKSLAHPASIDSIPTCENQEDHVSMAPIAARKAGMILKNVQKIVAIEMLFAAQALDIRMAHLAAQAEENLNLGKGTAAAHEVIRETIPFLSKDRPLYRFIEQLHLAISENRILRAVENVVGELN